MQDNWRDVAEDLVESLEEFRPPDFFHTLRDVIDEKFPRGRGRRKGEGSVDDSARLDQLAEHLRSGVDEQEAIRLVARDDPGDSETNTRRRLRRKLPAAKERLKEAERDEILRRAFEEPVEIWDL